MQIPGRDDEKFKTLAVRDVQGKKGDNYRSPFFNDRLIMEKAAWYGVFRESLH